MTLSGSLSNAMIDENTTVFFDDSSPLSNNAYTPFFYSGFEFKTMTHFLEFQKNIKFQQSNSAKDVLKSSSPVQSEAFNERLTFGDRHQWYAVCDHSAYTGLMAKFQQNPDLMQQLLKTKHSQLAYAVAEDGYWGTGVSKTDANRLNENRWPGKNKLGQLLEKVRTNFMMVSNTA